MGYTWKKAKLYANKTTSGGDTIDEKGVSENIAVPETYIDYNNCGKIVFVTVRPSEYRECLSSTNMSHQRIWNRCLLLAYSSF